jgi:hypothetical protein
MIALVNEGVESTDRTFDSSPVYKRETAEEVVLLVVLAQETLVSSGK